MACSGRIVIKYCVDLQNVVKQFMNLSFSRIESCLYLTVVLDSALREFEGVFLIIDNLVLNEYSKIEKYMEKNGIFLGCLNIRIPAQKHSP